MGPVLLWGLGQPWGPFSAISAGLGVAAVSVRTAGGSGAVNQELAPQSRQLFLYCQHIPHFTLLWQRWSHSRAPTGLICLEDGGLGRTRSCRPSSRSPHGQGQGRGLDKPSATSRRRSRQQRCPACHSSSGSVPTARPHPTRARPGLLGAHRGGPGSWAAGGCGRGARPGEDGTRALTRAQPLRVLLVLLLLLPPGQLLHLTRREPG